MRALVQLEGLVVRRGTFTLGPVSLAVPAGQYLVVVGPSGAGKTVLLESILGWYPAEAGRRLWCGEAFAHINPATQRVAYLPQRLPLLPHLTVMENLTFGVACRGAKPDQELLDHLVEVLDLGSHLSRRDVRTLSRGEQQRLALAQALLTRPQLLLLDEPTTALDPHRKPELWKLLRQLHRELALTVVHVTHDRQEAYVLADQLAVVLDGRLQQLATPAQAYRQPANLAVARFLAPENLWPLARLIRQQGSTWAELVQPAVRLRVGQAGNGCYLGIRPEEVALIDPQRPLRPQVQDNLFTARVEELLVLDGQAQLAVCTREGLPVVLRLPLCAVLDRGLSPGQEVRICLKAASLYLLEDSANLAG